MAFWDFSKSDNFDFEIAKPEDAYVLTFQDSERYVDIKLSSEGITQVKDAINLFRTREALRHRESQRRRREG